MSNELFEAINEAARDLPDKCEIHIVIENGSAYVEAYDKTGGFVDFDEHMLLEDSIRDALRHIIEDHEP